MAAAGCGLGGGLHGRHLRVSAPARASGGGRAPCAAGRPVVRSRPVSTDAETPPAEAEPADGAEGAAAGQQDHAGDRRLGAAGERRRAHALQHHARTEGDGLRDRGGLAGRLPNTVPLITYSEIRLALGAREDVEERFLAFAPDAVHIATEGTLGWDARAICLKHKFPFTTSYHTQFPEYVTARFSWIPLWAGYRYMHAFHDKSGRMMVATPTMLERLAAHGFRNIAHLEPRRRHRTLSSLEARHRRRRLQGPAETDLRSMSAACRWRRTSRRSSSSTCPARRSSSAAGRRSKS